MCKSCGHLSEDLSTCIRCRRKLPDDVKLLDDPAFKPKPDSTDHVAKKALRGVRLPTKNRRKANPDEPVCIALSSDEEGDDDNSRSSLVDNAEIGEEESGRNLYRIEVLASVFKYSISDHLLNSLINICCGPHQILFFEN